MADLDPQVQIRIIDLAEKWADYAMPRIESQETGLTLRTEKFDKAYKAIRETVSE